MKTHAPQGRWTPSAALLQLALSLAACSGGSEKAVTTAQADRFATVLDSGGEFEQGTDSVVSTPHSPTLEMMGNEPWQCTTTTTDLVKNPEEFALFDPNAEVIWPGSLLQGASLADATPRPIPLRRGPGRIAVTLLTGVPDGVSRDVEEVSLANVYDAANEVIAGAPEKLAARFSFTMDRVASGQQLAVAANASFKGWGAKVSAALSLEQDSSYNHFLVRLTQSFYTIAIEPPASYASMFAPTVEASDLAQYVGPGNPAAYISSVTYGRIFYLLVESTERADQMAASINASFSGFGVSGDGSASVRWVGNLENLRIKAFALGGDAAAAISAITTDFSALQSFLGEGGTVGTAAPISYVVRSVRHPDQVVRMKLATTYDITDCVPLMESFGAPIIWLDASDIRVNDAVPSAPADISAWKDKSGATNDAFWDRGTYGKKPQVVPGLVNAVMPAVVFSSDGFEPSDLRFYGGGFASDAYSLVVVAAISRNAAGSGYDFLRTFGSPDYYSGMEMGFLPGTASGGDFLRAQFGFKNGGDQNGVYTEQTADQSFRVYTFVYDGRPAPDGTGMRYWVNGQLAAEDATALAPVTDFMGARLGALQTGGGAGEIDLAEIIAYKGALTDAQRQYVEQSLMWKYRM